MKIRELVVYIEKHPELLDGYFTIDVDDDSKYVVTGARITKLNDTFGNEYPCVSLIGNELKFYERKVQ